MAGRCRGESAGAQRVEIRLTATLSACRALPMLSLNAITVRLGGRLILDRATAALPPGSRVGLVGRNGAGKSTLMRVVAGLHRGGRGRRRDAAGGADRLYRAGDAGRPRHPVRDGARRRRRARRPAPRRRDHARPPPPRRDPRAAERDRRPCRAGPRRPHPRRARLRRGGAAAAARQLLGRLADAGRARRLALLGARTCCCSTSPPTISTSKRRSGSRISCAPTARPC